MKEHDSGIKLTPPPLSWGTEAWSQPNFIAFPWPLKFSHSSFRSARNVFQATLAFWTLKRFFSAFLKCVHEGATPGSRFLYACVGVLTCVRVLACVDRRLLYNSRPWHQALTGPDRYDRYQFTVGHVKVNINNGGEEEQRQESSHRDRREWARWSSIWL